jgi:hypothetical protein
VVNGDVPGNGAAGGGATGGEGSGDETAWLDLIARFDAPGPESGGGGVPWPEREDLTGAVPVTPAVPDTLPADPPAAPAGPPGPPWSRLGAAGPRDTVAPEDPADEHFVPPPPPPLPKIDPVTKAAWLFLFGGPCYLLIATAVGWTITGLAAFLAVAAFVGGFAVLVLRMDNGGPRDSGPDDGAVV